MIVKSDPFTASSKVSLREIISSISRPKVSAVRRAIATDPCSLFPCFLQTDISANLAGLQEGPRDAFPDGAHYEYDPKLKRTVEVAPSGKRFPVALVAGKF